MWAIARLAAHTGAFTVLLGASLTAGCGDSDPPTPVTLDIVSPADAGTVHERAVEVRGRVDPPDARVLVRGQPATVSGGAFRAYVPLREGSTVIDVGGYRSGATAAWTAVRVARQVVVTVPDLAGTPEDEAVAQLEDLGLRAQVVEDGGLLDSLLPTDWTVCASQPDAGAKLPKGTLVRLAVSKTC
jgi:hypothetical protein